MCPVADVPDQAVDRRQVGRPAHCDRAHGSSLPVMAAQVVRVWSGTVHASDADAYLELMREHAIPDYRAVPGNLGAQVWHRPEGDGTVRVTTVSWWDSRASIEAFAGDDIEMARYYDFDDRYLARPRPGDPPPRPPPRRPLTVRRRPARDRRRGAVHATQRNAPAALPALPPVTPYWAKSSASSTWAWPSASANTLRSKVMSARSASRSSVSRS